MRRLMSQARSNVYGMDDSHECTASAYPVQALQRALEVGFPPRGAKERRRALATVGAVVKHTTTEDAPTLVMGVQ